MTCKNCQIAIEFPDYRMFNPACVYCGARYIQLLGRRPLPDRASITVPSRAGPDPALQRLEADRAAWKPPAPEVKAMIAQTVERLKARAS